MSANMTARPMTEVERVKTPAEVITEMANELRGMREALEKCAAPWHYGKVQLTGIRGDALRLENPTKGAL